MRTLLVSLLLLAPPAAAGRHGPPARSRPGTLSGSFRGQPVGLRFTHRGPWTVRGQANSAAVELGLDREAGRISGSANGAAVELRYAWSPERIELSGSARGGSLRYVIDWERKTVEGEAAGRPIRLRFTPEWDIAGEAAGEPVDLHWQGSGGLDGSLAGGQLRVGIMHLQVAEFLTHLYLFL